MQTVCAEIWIVLSYNAFTKLFKMPAKNRFNA